MTTATANLQNPMAKKNKPFKPAGEKLPPGCTPEGVFPSGGLKAVARKKTAPPALKTVRPPPGQLP
jgi:hypothetical protein